MVEIHIVKEGIGKDSDSESSWHGWDSDIFSLSESTGSVGGSLGIHIDSYITDRMEYLM